MLDDEEMISKKEAMQQVNLAIRRLALLYHYFADTIIEQLGQESGIEIIRKAISAYGEHIGREARKKAEEKGVAPVPENFEEDIPEMAWKWEVVQVEGEERTRVCYCPLASEWIKLGKPEIARFYCYVDQAKMFGFNPEYEYIHTKNILNGDPYCELVARIVSEKNNKNTSEEPVNTVWSYCKRYTKEDLINMEPSCLRALFRERIHHTIECELYPIAEKLRKGEKIQLDTDIPEPFTETEMDVVKKAYI
ncbi:hypothetical protein DRQ09_02195 [candidate division KSB1 bacterium]|nr:MAG: hypothetical protein DRQ09_02195 [candidate division KSB1 bacterium]